MSDNDASQGDLAQIDAPARAARGKARKPGRPPAPATERRMRSFRVSVTFAERNRIRARAEQAGLPTAVFVREAALGAALTRVEIPAPAHEVRAELAAIGRNLNQLARATNAGERVAQGDLADVIARLSATVQSLALAFVTGQPPTLEGGEHA